MSRQLELVEAERPGCPGAWDRVCVWSCQVTGISLRLYWNLLEMDWWKQDGVGGGWQMGEALCFLCVNPDHPLHDSWGRTQVISLIPWKFTPPSRSPTPCDVTGPLPLGKIPELTGPLRA